MESYAFTFRLTLADWRDYQTECARRVRQTFSRRWMIVLVCTVALGVVVAAGAFDTFGMPMRLASAVAGMLFVAIPMRLYWRFWAKACAPESGSLFYDEFRYVFDSDGIRMIRPGVEALTRWSAVRSVTSSAAHLYLWIDRMQAHVIPTRALPAGTLPADLLATVERWRGGGMTGATVANLPPGESTTALSIASPPTASEGRSWISGLPRLLSLRHAPGMKDAPPWTVWLLAGLALVAWVGVDWLREGPDAMFFPYTAPGIAWYVLMLLAIAAALSSFSTPRVPLGSTLASLLALVLVLFALAAVAILLPLPKAAVVAGALAIGLYCIVVAARLLSSMTGRNQPRALSNAALILVAAWFLTECLYVDPGVWYAPDLDAYADYSEDQDQAESLLFEQPARIDAAIAKVAAPDDEVPAAFFVGFAGYGGERVFAEEIKLAARVLGERYDLSDRSVLLLNDRRDVDSQPIATATSLRYTLRELAAKMDVDADVLFLSLSSHGSEDASLSVSNEPLTLKDLTDEELAAALRESGIKWRVIVISACYSGSFIDVLRDPNTIVITAAAADRTSFGCSDSRDLTYFGEAFYRDALPESPSLREAFETAAEAISRREQTEGVDASNPQAHFGEAIERKLELFERF